LLTESETLPATYFHVERAYELSQRVNILMGFDEKLTTNQKYKLLYKDNLGVFKYPPEKDPMFIKISLHFIHWSFSAPLKEIKIPK
jgi:hypothetical protein